MERAKIVACKPKTLIATPSSLCASSGCELLRFAPPQGVSTLASSLSLDFAPSLTRRGTIGWQSGSKPNYRVWIRFDDGLEGEVDLSYLVGQGVFEAWKSIDCFNQVQVNPRTETLAWGEDIDLDPYVLREKISEL